MPGIEELKVSLTKNGYFKVAEIVKQFPRSEVLDRLNGVHQGIILNRPQIANMLSADAETGELPEVWDDIRAYPERSVEAFTFISILFSHYKLIEAFKAAATLEMRGVLRRSELGDKPYTNIVDSMRRIGLCSVVTGAEQTPYNFQPLFQDMSIGPLVKQLFALKLRKTGWQPPAPNDFFTRDFYEQCYFYGFHAVLGISRQQFEDWLEGRAVQVEQPPTVALPQREVRVSASLVAALAAKPFVIMSGPTGTGKTTTVRQLAQSLRPEGVEEKFNYAFIPVEAGWTDGRHLVGYRNPFGRSGEQYTATPLISLLLRANYAPYAEIPFFIILDEMNLSYVEMYFSRFLSLMEAKEGGEPEPILNPDDLALLLGPGSISAMEATLVDAALQRGGLFLTPNVFIVGTVNVDETTHMFSPKVLDRAFVLEMQTSLPSRKCDGFQIADEDAAVGSAEAVSRYLAEARSLLPSTVYDTFLDEVYERLGRFRFGPRVTLEAQRHVAACAELAARLSCHASFAAEATTKDRLLMQKLLPKVHGNRSQLGTTLDELAAYVGQSGCERALAKLEGMRAELKSPGFTNYFAQQ